MAAEEGIGYVVQVFQAKGLPPDRTDFEDRVKAEKAFNDAKAAAILWQTRPPTEGLGWIKIREKNAAPPAPPPPPAPSNPPAIPKPVTPIAPPPTQPPTAPTPPAPPSPPVTPSPSTPSGPTPPTVPTPNAK